MTRPLEPTATDLKTLRRLIKRARQLAAEPLDEALRLRLQKTSDQARATRLPVGHQGRDSVFLPLIEFGRTWWRLTPRERGELAGELRRLAKACEVTLPAEIAAPVATRFRADLDG